MKHREEVVLQLAVHFLLVERGRKEGKKRNRKKKGKEKKTNKQGDATSALRLRGGRCGGSRHDHRTTNTKNEEDEQIWRRARGSRGSGARIHFFVFFLAFSQHFSDTNAVSSPKRHGGCIIRCTLHVETTRSVCLTAQACI